MTSSAGREDDISKEIEALLSRSGAKLAEGEIRWAFAKAKGVQGLSMDVFFFPRYALDLECDCNGIE